ncbi:hypothetical protein Aperf_G00000026157 [Anoplocephala perfoliata]
MAPFLHALAQCLEVPLDNKSLEYVAEREKQNICEAPFYEVAVKKSNVRLTPVEKGEKKLKKINFKKATEMHIDESSDTIALSVPHKKKDPLCLDIKFIDSISRKEFQTLAKTTNPQLKVSSPELPTYSKPRNIVQPDNINSQSGSTTSTETWSSYPLPSRQYSLPGGQSAYPNTGSKMPASTQLPSICSHCHQRKPNGYKSSKMEYDPPHLPSSFSSDSIETPESYKNNSCVIYVGPNSSTANIHRPTGRYVFERRFRARERNRLYNSDIDETNSTTLSTTDSGYGHKTETGTTVRVSPSPSRRPVSLKFKKMPPKEFQRSDRSSYSGYKPPKVFLIFDSSSEEEEDEGGYDEASEASTNYSDSLENEFPINSREVKGLHRNPRRFRHIWIP